MENRPYSRSTTATNNNVPQQDDNVNLKNELKKFKTMGNQPVDELLVHESKPYMETLITHELISNNIYSLHPQ